MLRGCHCLSTKDSILLSEDGQGFKCFLSLLLECVGRAVILAWKSIHNILLAVASEHVFRSHSHIFNDTGVI